MFNSNNIQSLFSSFQDNPFPLFYNTDPPFNNSNQNQENPPLVSSSNFNTFIDEHQLPFDQVLSPIPMQATIQCDVVDDDDQENGNNHHKSINRMENPSTKRLNNPTSSSPSRRKIIKKSTHSKICTAQGVRDRRMRLSLPIARKFFDLQDMLGFDKPSKTIEWLFSNSQEPIKELQRKLHSQGNDDSEPKFMPEFEVKSSNGDIQETPNDENDIITKSRKKSMYNYNHAKQCRERARARARERTREKRMKMKGLKQLYESSCPSNNNEVKQCLENFFPFEDHHVSSYTHQYDGVSHENDSYNSTGFMEIWMHATIV